MSKPVPRAVETSENLDFLHELLEQCLSRGELEVPMLPDIAVRIMRLSQDDTIGAQRLAEVITADQALAMHVLRIAGSAAYRPATPVSSLQQAIAWLGFDEVTNIAVTLALQGRMLEVAGHRNRIRLLWRHSLLSALWARHLAHMLAKDSGLVYVCGLLHGIGKPVTLSVAYDFALRSHITPSGRDLGILIETFHRPMGMTVAKAWGLPQAAQTSIAYWEADEPPERFQFECAVVKVAHRLADLCLDDADTLGRDALLSSPAFLELGLSAQDGPALYAAEPMITMELDRYLRF